MRPLGVLFHDPLTKTPIQNNLISKPKELSKEVMRPQNQKLYSPPLGLLISPIKKSSSPPVLQTRVFSQIYESSMRNSLPRSGILPRAKWSAPHGSKERPLGTLYSPTNKLNNQTNLSNTSGNPRQQSQTISNSSSESSTDEPLADFQADQMSFDENQGIVEASGNVQVFHKDRTLTADKIVHYQNTGNMIAKGNVMIIESDGKVIFGDEVDISNDLKDGIIKNIGIILKDRTRIAGTLGKRSKARYTELLNGVYSACDLCPEDQSAPLVWQIKAVKVTHDQKGQVVRYNDAWLEFFDIPVIYTPYFQHPDPSVRRKTGFLFPSFGTSSDLGTIIKSPYFIDISAHEDATLNTIITSSTPPIFDIEHRKKMKTGEYNSSGSITANSDSSGVFGNKDGEYDVRGHLNTVGKFDVNRNWRWGFDIARASDDTYMRRFGFGSSSSLESVLFTESFRKQSYFSARAQAFQSLHDEDPVNTIPYILPKIDFNHIGKKDRLGGVTELNFDLTSIFRSTGTDTRRLSSQTKWVRPFVGSLGEFYNTSLGVNADFYHVNSLSRQAPKDTYSGFSKRVVPYVELNWRMPFVKKEGTSSQVLEPITAIIISPYGGNHEKIPNEDSLEMEFDDTNLFSTNRFSGLDRVEGGPRIAYGLKWSIYGDAGGSSRVLVGQSYRPKTDATFASGSGLEDNFSDIVSRLDISPGKHLNISYRTRFAHENLSPERNEISLNTGVPAFNLTTNYIFLDRQSDSEFLGREELNFSTQSQLNRFWKAKVNGIRDMASSEFRSAGVSLVYEDECIVFSSTGDRTFYEDRDLEPTNRIIFNIFLKTIGSLPSIDVK